MTLLKLSQEALDRLKCATSDSGNIFHFLGFSLNLQTGDLQDVLQQKIVSPAIKDSTMYNQITELLVKYAFAGKHVRIGKLVTFKDFSGGYAYENAFYRRVVDSIVKLFGSNPQELLRAAELLGGKQLEYGDYSVEIEALPGIPLTLILWADEELPPTANVLFDESSGKFFNVEDLALLSDMTVWRLSVAQNMLRGKV
ncbi:MAG: DUF3786 domain-containing protein [Candidatus Bathyarchaeota archaeon]|nr:DUF3786 domain-containing protein [Candidatus Termiticorpusculum sp.]